MTQKDSLFPNLNSNNNGVHSDKTELFDEKGNSRGFYSKKNRLNELTGREWVYWTKSVVNKQYPPDFQHELRSQHGGQKPPRLCADLIKIFTKEEQRVLDPLMGVGGTLLGASLANRRAIGIEINPKWVDLYKRVCKAERIKKQKTYIGDCKGVLKTLRTNFDFILTDVPYWHMDKVGRSKGKFKKVGEKVREKPESKLSSFNGEPLKTKQEWLDEMSKIFTLCYRRLKTGGYLAVFVGDMYHKGKYHRLSDALANVIEDTGYVMKANLIWYDVSKKLHIYGYQYTFIPSMIHQNILIFQKER